MGFPGGSDGKQAAHHVGDLGSIPGLGRSPEEGKDYPLQCSGLENSMECMVHGVAKSRTRLMTFSEEIAPLSGVTYESGDVPTLCRPLRKRKCQAESTWPPLPI